MISKILRPNRIAFAALACFSALGSGPVMSAAAAKMKKKAAPTSSSPGAIPALAPADSSPLAELKKSNLSLKKILQKQRPSWSPEAETKNAELKKVVGGFLDFEELSHRALARHWEGLAPKQRADFVHTLQELVERSYVKQVYGQPEYDLAFDKETRAGNEGSVAATLNTVARQKKIKVALEYKMVWKAGHWVVYDVITDEQSMLENYRAEFNKIIAKESFDALLKRMQKKLDKKNE